MIFCNLFAGDDGLWRCTRCGWVSKKPYAKAPRRNCNVQPFGLGDAVAWLLYALCGLTPRRWNRIRRAVGLSKPCGCAKRQAALNAAGGKVAGRWRKWLGRS